MIEKDVQVGAKVGDGICSAEEVTAGNHDNRVVN